MQGHFFGDMVKGVIDVEKKEIALDAELHADLESLLLSKGSERQNLWGFNLYPDMDDEDFIEYDSLINIRPSQGNRSRQVEDPEIRNSIKNIIFHYASNPTAAQGFGDRALGTNEPGGADAEYRQ